MLPTLNPHDLRRLREDLKIDQDCKQYYTTSCTLVNCPFRHEPAALKSYVTCSFWRKRNCRKAHCEYRHIELQRDEIPCYWEKKPQGCQKDDCPFQHSLPRRTGSANRMPRPNERSRSVPRVRVSNSARARKTHSTDIRSDLQVNEKVEKLEDKLKELEKKLREKTKERENVMGKNKGKKLKQKLEDMEKKLHEKEQEKKHELKKHQEELDAQTSSTLQVLQDELEASMNASNTCMSATEEIIRTVGTTMREEFECKICFELFITPMTLNCSHSFCEYCINLWRTHDPYCPQCRQRITSQARVRAVENFIERMVSSLTEDLKERRNRIMRIRNAETI